MAIKADVVDQWRLTKREAQIAEKLCEGKSNKEIASDLAIAIKTVDVHIGTIYEKLDLRNRSINTRCTAILTLIARGIVRLSVKAVVAILICNAAMIDDEALRVRGGRSRVRVVHARRVGDA